jgi:hypothetical protein
MPPEEATLDDRCSVTNCARFAEDDGEYCAAHADLLTPTGEWIPVGLRRRQCGCLGRNANCQKCFGMGFTEPGSVLGSGGT